MNGVQDGTGYQSADRTAGGERLELTKSELAEGGFARSGKSYGRLYEQQISGEEYYTENVFSVGADKLEMLFDALLSSQSVNKQLLDRFAEKIEAKKQSLG